MYDVLPSSIWPEGMKQYNGIFLKLWPALTCIDFVGVGFDGEKEVGVVGSSAVVVGEKRR